MAGLIVGVILYYYSLNEYEEILDTEMANEAKNCVGVPEEDISNECDADYRASMGFVHKSETKNVWIMKCLILGLTII